MLLTLHLTSIFIVLQKKKIHSRNSLVILGLRLHAPSAGDLGWIPGQGTRSHMLQLRVPVLQLRPGAAK